MGILQDSLWVLPSDRVREEGSCLQRVHPSSTTCFQMSRLKRLHHLEINNSLSTKRSKSESGCSEIGSGTEGCSAVSGVALEGAVQVCLNPPI